MNGVIVHRANKELINRVIAEKRRRFNTTPTFRFTHLLTPTCNDSLPVAEQEEKS